MKVKDIIKKQTTVIAIAVALVAVTVIGVSYAIFFDVQKNTNNQVITAGTLKLTIADVSALDVSEPLDEASGLKSDPASYTVNNTGNLPANYKIYIYADTDNAVELSKIKVSTDGNATQGNTAKALSSIAERITENGNTYYEIGSGSVNAGASDATKYVRVWVDEDSITGEVSDKKVDLSIYIVSEVQES